MIITTIECFEFSAHQKEETGNDFLRRSTYADYLLWISSDFLHFLKIISTRSIKNQC